MTHVEPGILTYFNVMLYFTHSCSAGDRGLGDVECRSAGGGVVSGCRGRGLSAGSFLSLRACGEGPRPTSNLRAGYKWLRLRRKNPHKARTARSGKKCITWREK